MWCSLSLVIVLVRVWIGRHRLRFNLARLSGSGFTPQKDFLPLFLIEVVLLQTDAQFGILTTPAWGAYGNCGQKEFCANLVCQLHLFLALPMTTHALIISCLDYCNAIYSKLVKLRLAVLILVHTSDDVGKLRRCWEMPNQARRRPQAWN